jgi:hypothetical protein
LSIDFAASTCFTVSKLSFAIWGHLVMWETAEPLKYPQKYPRWSGVATKGKGRL